jgi:hypothetical protein
VLEAIDKLPDGEGNKAMSEQIIKTPVAYLGDEDGFIYDADNDIVADLDSLSDGCYGDDAHPGVKEFHEYRNCVGEHIATCINEHESLRQRVLDLEAENAGLIAGLKQAEGYVMETREALALRDCVECGICAFDVSPVDSSQGFCWNCHEFLTIKRAEKILNGGDDE